MGKAALRLKVNSKTASMSFYEGHGTLCVLLIYLPQRTQKQTYILEQKYNYKVFSLYSKKPEDRGPMCKKN